MEKHEKIYVAGHRGLVGSAIVKTLKTQGFSNILVRTHAELDLTDQRAVAAFFAAEKPDYVFLAAAKVGGIMANNTYRADFIYDNLMIEANVIRSAWEHNTKKLLFLGSTCIYPRDAPQPMAEEALLTSPLEYTNEPYAVAKIAGIKLCESFNVQYGTNFVALMPTNLYGPGDNFDLEKSHVLPALLRKLYLGSCIAKQDWKAIQADFKKRPVEGVDGKDIYAVLAKLEKYGVRTNDCSGQVEVEVWGSGKPLREFLWSEEMADACVYVMQNVDWNDLVHGKTELRNAHLNIGTGREVSIRQLAETIASATGFPGKIVFNAEKPDGTMRKLTDPSRLHGLGWHHQIELSEGVDRLYHWYLEN